MYIFYENFVKNVHFLQNFRKKCNFVTSVMVDELSISNNDVNLHGGTRVKKGLLKRIPRTAMEGYPPYHKIWAACHQNLSKSIKPKKTQRLEYMLVDGLVLWHRILKLNRVTEKLWRIYLPTIQFSIVFLEMSH